MALAFVFHCTSQGGPRTRRTERQLEFGRRHGLLLRHFVQLFKHEGKNYKAAILVDTS